MPVPCPKALRKDQSQCGRAKGLPCGWLYQYVGACKCQQLSQKSRVSKKCDGRRGRYRSCWTLWIMKWTAKLAEAAGPDQAPGMTEKLAQVSGSCWAGQTRLVSITAEALLGFNSGRQFDLRQS